MGKCESFKNKAKEIETGNIRVCITGVIYPRMERKLNGWVQTESKGFGPISEDW